MSLVVDVVEEWPLLRDAEAIALPRQIVRRVVLSRTGPTACASRCTRYGSLTRWGDDSAELSLVD